MDVYRFQGLWKIVDLKISEYIDDVAYDDMFCDMVD